MFRCLVGAAHRVVLVTFTLACGFLSLLKHLPHTHLLTIALKQQRQTKKRSRTSVTFSSLAWADASSFVSKIQFHGDHSSYLFHRTRIRSNRSSRALSTIWLFQMFSTRQRKSGSWKKRSRSSQGSFSLHMTHCIDACALMVKNPLRKKLEKKLGPPRWVKLWKRAMKNRIKIFLEPDYMIRNGPSARLGCFV